VSDVQKRILEPSSKQLSRRDIMKFAGGHGATIKIARRKLDQFAAVKSQCFLANDDRRLQSMANRLQLAASISFISRGQDAITKKKKRDTYTEQVTIAPTALLKMGDNRDIKKLSKKEMSSVLCLYYSIEMDHAKHKKSELANKLGECVASDPGKLPAGAIV
jgi:hypothetical protein